MNKFGMRQVLIVISLSLLLGSSSLINLGSSEFPSDFILNTRESQLNISKPEMLNIIEHSPFNIQNSLTNLVNFYQKLWGLTQVINEGNSK